ncbi:hypothetical protein CKA32_004128 [Geitlerinema sp. FC II]|nr:hypothetical protein CKA32_004128 [Geitlerinema sp. FC II]
MAGFHDLRIFSSRSILVENRAIDLGGLGRMLKLFLSFVSSDRV